MKKLLGKLAILATISLVARRVRIARLMAMQGRSPFAATPGCRMNNMRRFEPRHSTLV